MCSGEKTRHRRRNKNKDKTVDWCGSRCGPVWGTELLCVTSFIYPPPAWTSGFMVDMWFSCVTVRLWNTWSLNSVKLLDLKFPVWSAAVLQTEAFPVSLCSLLVAQINKLVTSDEVGQHEAQTHPEEPIVRPDDDFQSSSLGFTPLLLQKQMWWQHVNICSRRRNIKRHSRSLVQTLCIIII